MFVSIRKYKVDSPGDITKKVNESFLPIVSKAPGFVAYYALEGERGIWASVSVFETREGAEESNRMAADWTKKNLASMNIPAPEITSGEVVSQKSKAAGKAAGN